MIKMIPHSMSVSDNPKQLKKALNYAADENAGEKTDPLLMTGFNCSSDPQAAFNEMMLVKELYGKDDKGECRFYTHFIETFPEGSVTKEEAFAIGRELIDSSPEIFGGFQIFMATHLNTDNLHNHFIVNTVNMKTGAMWHQSKADLKALKKKEIEICRAHGIRATWLTPSQKKSADRSEYEVLKRGISWKQEMMASVMYCLTESVDKWDLILKMKDFGYRINWWEDREDLTIIAPEGWRCSSKKLDKSWDQAFFEDAFLKNADNNEESPIGVKRRLMKKTEDMERAVNFALFEAESKEAFIALLNAQDYSVSFRDDRVHIVITPKGEAKGYRLTTLLNDKTMTKEALLDQFEKNAAFHSQMRPDDGHDTHMDGLDREIRDITFIKDETNRLNAIVDLCVRRATDMDDLIEKLSIFDYQVKEKDDEVYFVGNGLKCALTRLDKIKGPTKWKTEDLERFFRRNAYFKAVHPVEEAIARDAFYDRSLKLSALLRTLFGHSDGRMPDTKDRRALTGQAAKEKAIELSARGIDWEKEH